ERPEILVDGGVKRLRRIVFNGLAALSALLLVATALLWVRSVNATDVLIMRGQTNRVYWKSTFVLGSEAGYLCLQYHAQNLVDWPQLTTTSSSRIGSGYHTYKYPLGLA